MARALTKRANLIHVCRRRVVFSTAVGKPPADAGAEAWRVRSRASSSRPAPTVAIDDDDDR